jgi:hypothetical protein
LSLHLIKHHAIKIDRGIGSKAPFFLNLRHLMDVSGKLHAPVALVTGKIAPGIHWIGGWVGPRAGLDKRTKRKLLSLSWIQPQIFCPSASITVLSELHGMSKYTFIMLHGNHSPVIFIKPKHFARLSCNARNCHKNNWISFHDISPNITLNATIALHLTKSRDQQYRILDG